MEASERVIVGRAGKEDVPGREIDQKWVFPAVSFRFIA
jgi:hypothetical protein